MRLGSGRTGRERPRDAPGLASRARASIWPAALALGVVSVLGVAALGVRTQRMASEAWDRLLDENVAALVDAERLATASELGLRLARDAAVDGEPATLRALGRNQAEVADLLGRAAARARTPEERDRVVALAEDHALLWRLGERAAVERLRGQPPGAVARRLQASAGPVRRRIDDGVAALVRAHEQDLTRARQQVAAGERRGLLALAGAAAVAVALAVLLGVWLRRSLGALRRSEARFRATFEHAGVGMAHVSPDGHWLRLNRRYRELLGCEREDLRAATVLDLTHPDDRAAEAQRSARLLAGEIDGYAAEERLLRRDGETQWVNVTCAIVRDGAGRTRYLVRSAEDVSARRRVEEELRGAVRARDEFLQVASHELRTPLATLRLQVESLRAALARGRAEPARAVARADAALRQTARLDALVDALIEVSRAGRGAVALQRERVDLAEVARRVLRRSLDPAVHHGIELHLRCRSVLAWADRARLEQALGHLLSNALRHGAGRPVEIRVEGEGALGRIVVVDHGAGVDPADAERIFGRFERATSWRHHGGLGLGLFLARRIAEAHGGTVRLERADGDGTAFVLEVPRELPREDLAPRDAGEPSGGDQPGQAH
ncbi:sensor histidine kinase [Anaeromyxobacter dehalogenans]|uniref:histidine kinase n=1 Tax=Anaeromyxobacter dehalogenans (strain 2CP-C) TaxID=290397 RepID=Q2IQ99_ANADE|nr:HAMP domain-containing sensor histidine kinase [Anaeromyxobacter dehalogenans]ABC80980.1 multi-sensor signal transduction histidine kinase [Anaeromyxobacter dehalogenans 2CP-C]